MFNPRLEIARRLVLYPDGSIDAAGSDAKRAATTDPAKQRNPRAGQRPVPEAATAAVTETLREQGVPAGGMTFVQARTANEVLKAQERRLKVQRQKGELVDRARAVALVFRVATPGPGYCHFPAGREAEWFDQLTAERVQTRYRHGFPHRVWVKPPAARNEALDCRVYGYAALASLNVNWGRLQANLEGSATAAAKAATLAALDAAANQASTTANGPGEAGPAAAAPPAPSPTPPSSTAPPQRRRSRQVIHSSWMMR